jgi:competence protein ComEA
VHSGIARPQPPAGQAVRVRRLPSVGRVWNRPSPAPRVAARVREVLGTGEVLRTDDGAAEPPPLQPAPLRAEVALQRETTLWQRLVARVPVRLDPGRRAAVGVGLAVALAAVTTALWLAAQRPHSLAVPAGPSIAGAASPVGSAASAAVQVSGLPASGLPVSALPSAAPTDVVVDVAGKVRHPGLYRLPPGARVDDAVRRAGGALRGVELSSLNLAARVVDGQQILVGLPPVAAPGGTGAGGASAAAAGPVSLNSATSDELEVLPGVGPVLAQHILDWRTAHGGFTSVDQLNDVPGIGEVKFADLRSLVTT